MTAPVTDGRGDESAKRDALADAGLAPGQIAYLNLHGTGTPQNDSMEAAAVARVLGGEIPCSSTKPLVGHTLGAAGAIEAAFCWLVLAERPGGEPALPPHVWDGARAPAPARTMLTAAFGGAEPDEIARLRTVFASRHGSINESIGLLENVVRREKLSPATFSHTVHNAQAGLFSIAAGNRAASSSLSAQEDSWTAAWLEALCFLERDPREPVLVVIC